MPRRNKTLAAWEPDDPGQERLVRLRDRHVLEAAGFQLRDTPARQRTGPARFERQPVARRSAR